MTPRQPAATDSLPDTRVPIAMRKPLPSSPSMLLSGTTTSVISNMAVLAVGMPSLAVKSSLAKPLTRSTMKALMRVPGALLPSLPRG
jgi:hypothetical protein